MNAAAGGPSTFVAYCYVSFNSDRSEQILILPASCLLNCWSHQSSMSSDHRPRLIDRWLGWALAPSCWPHPNHAYRWHCMKARLKMADVSSRSPPQARSLPLGAQISCTTTHGDVLRGNIIATDETNEAVVISILRKMFIIWLRHRVAYVIGNKFTV